MDGVGSQKRNPRARDMEESDQFIGPKKWPNNLRRRAEAMEGKD
jgi:hypothetical protein